MFEIDICKISYESEPSYEKPIIIENFLANYHDIFSYELLKIAPQREVDYTIELVHGVAPIAKAPYIHSFKENINFQTQL